MKKLVSLTLSALLALSMLAGCSNPAPAETTPSAPETTPPLWRPPRLLQISAATPCWSSAAQA